MSFILAFLTKSNFPGAASQNLEGAFQPIVHVPEVRGMWGTHLIPEESLSGLSGVID